MNIHAFLSRKTSSLQPPPCQVEAVIELDAASFENLLHRPLDDQPQITAHKSLMCCGNGVEHCVLFLGEASQDGVLVNSEGYDWARYAAFIPSARMIVNATLDQAIERMVKEGAENTHEGNWRFYFNELYEQMGLVVTPDNGFGTMLMDRLALRPEIADVEFTEDCFNMVYHLSNCKNFSAGSGTESQKEMEPAIHLRDLVTLGLPDHDVYLVHQTADVGFIPAADLAALSDQGKERFAALLDARVSSIKQGAYGVEVELSGIEPELLTRYDQAVADSQQPTPAMGYFM